MANYILAPNGELYHYGVKGMKWGVRRYQKKNGFVTSVGKKRRQRLDDEKAYREKLSNTLKNKNLNESDRKRFEFRNQSYGKRFLKTAAGVATGMMIQEAFTGGLGKYANMDKKQLVGELTKKAAVLTTATASNLALSDALAKSASKRYDSSGKKVKGVKDHLVTKEDVIQRGIETAVAFIPVAATIAGMKMSSARAERAANEARFNAWGGRILGEGVGNLVWQSEDGTAQIFDRLRR